MCVKVYSAGVCVQDVFLVKKMRNRLYSSEVRKKQNEELVELIEAAV